MSVRDLPENPSARHAFGVRSPGTAGKIRVDFRKPDAATRPGTLLAAIRFGRLGSDVSAALRIDVELEPLNDPDCLELWPAIGPIVTGSDGAVRFAHDDHHLIAVMECDEREHGGIAAAAEWTYAAIRRFQRHSQFPHLLRIWNYFDAINEGAGDLERYRQFCAGRVRGLGDTAAELYPAASAIGRKISTHRLQVYWLAARAAGACVENPRQISAYRYPREHGPSAPAFARAMVVADGSLLISGTASIVGHESQHRGDHVAQVGETIRNLRALAAHAFTASEQRALLKVYVREPHQRAAIEERLRDAWPNVTLLFLAADICRRELLLEIEGVITVER